MFHNLKICDFNEYMSDFENVKKELPSEEKFYSSLTLIRLIFFTEVFSVVFIFFHISRRTNLISI